MRPPTATVSLPYPERVCGLDAARQRFGPAVDALLARLWDGDPLADAVVATLAEAPRERARFERLLTRGRREDYAGAPRAFVDFFQHLDDVPTWVDWPKVDRAGALFFRTGLAGGIVLGAKSLCHGYCSPGGNKPLVLTGQLTGESMGKRLGRTSRFVLETCRSGGLRRLAPGFQITVRVRLMHAGVRAQLWRDPRWRPAAWGLPINQHDMIGTALLFSLSFIEGVRTFGFEVSHDEADDYLHLWRYASHIMGVDDDLYPRAEDEARLLADMILATQGPPDADARRLVDALVQAPARVAETPAEKRRAQRQVALGYGFCRTLLGDEMADGLDLPRTPHRLAIPAFRRLVSAADSVRRHVPPLGAAYLRAGERYWEDAIAQSRAEPA